MEIEDLEKKRGKLLKEFLSLGDMRRGTLTERYVRCNKWGCRCSQSGGERHGPSYSLTYKEKGKTKTETVQRWQLERVKEQLGNHQHFRELIHLLVEVSEKICRARGYEVEEGTQEAVAVKKKLQKTSKQRRHRR